MTEQNSNRVCLKHEEKVLYSQLGISKYVGVEIEIDV